MRTLALIALLAPPAAHAELVGGLDFTLGFGDDLEVTGESAMQGDLDTPLDPSLAITPFLETTIGSIVGVGFEYMFIWYGADSDGGSTNEHNFRERRLVMDPRLRLRMSFPIVDKVTFDGMLAVGGSMWTSVDGVDDDEGGAFRFGWSLRFAFGGSYKFNKSVAAFAHLGYYTATSFGDDRELTMDSVPLSIGLRSAF